MPRQGCGFAAYTLHQVAVAAKCVNVIAQTIGNRADSGFDTGGPAVCMVTGTTVFRLPKALELIKRDNLPVSLVVMKARRLYTSQIEMTVK